MGKGDVKLRIGGINHVINDVYLIPELKSNLLSIEHLQQKGLTIVFQPDSCKIFHKENGLIIHSKMSRNRMFVVIVGILIPNFFKESEYDNTQLWHRRYGHLSFKGLNLVIQKNMVMGFPALQDSKKVCGECMVGKHHRDSFPKKSSWRASKILEPIHANICGSIKPESNSKKRYLITFIDDFSRNMGLLF